MSRKWAAALIVLMPVLSQAQGSPDSAVYRRAQMLVNDGNATAGRAIVDSMITRATPGTIEYAEGLYWRAVLSATASDAEMDYRRIVVDHPISPRVEDVLLRLAQLELARADYDGALQHLNRLTLEHPTGMTRARAGYWTARVLFEKNDVQRACAVNADALARTSVNDTELRNQISYLHQRCAGVVIATVPTPVSAASSVSDSASGVKTNPSAAINPTLPAAASVISPPSAPVNAPVTSPPPVPKSGSAVVQSTTAANPTPQPPTTPRDVYPSMIVPSAKEGAPTSTTTTSTVKPATGATSSRGSSGEGNFSVQVAAYNVKSQAQAMVDKLRKNGYDARISGTSAPFRVRIGRYATQAQASAVMRSLKAKQIDGFVVKAD